MTVYRPPALDKNAPIVDPKSGRITVYFQRFWQNLSLTAADGANQNSDIASLQTQVSTLNGQVTTINAALPGKAPLASPALTGTPTTPSAAAGTNTTQIASCAFVVTHAIARSTFTSWAAATGTAERTTFATYTAPTISNPPTQAEVQGIADAVQILSRRVKALIDDLKI